MDRTIAITKIKDVHPFDLLTSGLFVVLMLSGGLSDGWILALRFREIHDFILGVLLFEVRFLFSIFCMLWVWSGSGSGSDLARSQGSGL